MATLPIRLIGRPNRIDTQARRYPVVRHSTVEGLEFRLIGPRAPLPEAEQLSDLDLAVHPDDWDRVREAVGFEPPVGRIHGCAICGGQWLGEGLTTVLPYFLDCRSNCVYYASACSPECVDRALTKVRGNRSLRPTACSTKSIPVRMTTGAIDRRLNELTPAPVPSGVRPIRNVAGLGEAFDTFGPATMAVN